MEKRCDKLSCPRCAPRLAETLQRRIHRYAEEDQLHHFITLTTSTEDAVKAFQELVKLWQQCEEKMTWLHYDTYMRHRQQRDGRRFNPKNSTLRWEALISEALQSDIEAAETALITTQVQMAVARQRKVYLKKLSSDEKRAFLAAYEEPIKQAMETRRTTHPLTPSERASIRETIERRYRDLLERTASPLRYIRVLEQGEGGHFHFHILCNYPLPKSIHAACCTETSRIYQSLYIVPSDGADEARISRYLTKLAKYATKFPSLPSSLPQRAYLSASRGYQLLSRAKRPGVQYIKSYPGMTVPDGSRALSMRELLRLNPTEGLPILKNAHAVRCLEHTSAAGPVDPWSYLALHIESDRPLADVSPKQRVDPRLSEEQRAVVDQLGQGKYHLVMGPAGTGKSTLVKAALDAYDIDPDHVAIVAFTGRAVEVLRGKVDGRYADATQTLHRLLRFQVGPGFRKSWYNIVPQLRWVFVDEISTVDPSLLARLLQSIPEEARVVMLGDPHQLPARSGDNLAAQLPTLAPMRVHRLSHNHRSGDAVVELAHRVLQHQLPDHRPIDEATMVELALGGWQVLTNTKRWAARINQSVLRQLPKGDGVTIHGHQFAIGHRVMFCKNNYTFTYNNGEMGRIEAITEEAITITTERARYVLPIEHLVEENALDHAYAITINKAQGSEFDRVALIISDLRVPLTPQNAQLSNNLLYTGITRARREVKVYIDARALDQCLHRNL
jgi:exodeoxyribonuclease V alpha subunit